MGCVLVKVCDPPLPDTAIRDFWHIDGVIIDGYSSDSKNGGLYTKAVSGRMRTDSSSLDVASATAAFNSPSHTDMSGEEKQKNTGNSNGIAAQKRAFVHTIIFMRNQGIAVCPCCGVYIPAKKELSFLTRKAWRDSVADHLGYDRTFIRQLGESTRIHSHHFVESDIRDAPRFSDEKWKFLSGRNVNATVRANGNTLRRPAGILYVYNGRLVYKSRRCAFLSRNTKQLDVEICDINDVKALDNFTSNKDNRVYPGQIVDINVDNKNSMPFHLGFLTKQAEEVSRQLGETCLRHRQKPKIFQFNSVDVDGVEIDLP